MPLTNEVRQNLFKAAAGLAAFGFAATGHELAGPLTTAFVSLAGNIASQFGVEVCMPFITKKWLSPHKEEVVNHHIQRALVSAIHTALGEIEAEYLVRDGVSPREEQSLRDFFTILRDRSQTEYIEATRAELGKQEILNYVYDRTASTQHLQDRLRIRLDPTSDEFYFTPGFIAWFPTRFAELVQFHFKEELKGEKGEQEKAKKAMDLLFFETLQDGLNELRDKQGVNQTELKTRLDNALTTSTQRLEKVEFYGEIWISAIRRNRDQLDRIEERLQFVQQELGLVGLGLDQILDLLRSVLSRSVQPGLLASVQFQALSQAVRETQSAFTEAQTNLANAEASVVALEGTIALNPAVAAALDVPLNQQRKDRDTASSAALTASTRQQEAEQALAGFLRDVAATQQAIQNATSHRADRARHLFEQGQFAEANAALNADDLRRDQADLLQQRDTVQDQLAQLARDFLLKASLTAQVKEPGWFAEAPQLYVEAIKTNEIYDTCFAYALFLQEHNRHLDAGRYYEKALLLSADATQLATILNNLANLYSATARPTQAEIAYGEALVIYRQLASENPATYLPYVATILNNLGILYSATSRPTQAETAYNDALVIRRQSASENPATYLPYVATTLNNLAALYAATSRPTQAETAYDDALVIRRQLAQDNPATYLPYVATTLNNLANLYSDTSRPTQAEIAYGEALVIYRQLASENPATYLPYVATILNNLGILYSATSRPTQAETAYNDALVIYRQLASENPATYLPYVATTLNNLAALYSATSRPTQAETAYDGALVIRRQLASENPATYLPDVATTLNNLAALYAATSRPTQAETAYDDALVIRRQLAQDNPATYLLDVATILNNLANLYAATSRPTQAETAYKEALGMQLDLARKNPDSYAVGVAETAMNLSIFYLQREPEPDREQSIEYALMALHWALPYQERVNLASRTVEIAIQICTNWGIDWQTELQKWPAAGGNQEGGLAENG